MSSPAASLPAPLVAAIGAAAARRRDSCSRSAPPTCSAGSSPCSGSPCSRWPHGPAQRLALLRRRRPALALLRRLPARPRPSAAFVRRLRLVDAARCRSRRSPDRTSSPRCRHRAPEHAGPAADRAVLRLRDLLRASAGRLFGYFAAGLWIALPYLGILFVEPGYHQKYTELTLPQLLGLTSVPDFPCDGRATGLPRISACGLSTLDSWHTRRQRASRQAASIAIKPSNSIFLFAPASSCCRRTAARASPLFVLGSRPRS